MKIRYIIIALIIAVTSVNIVVAQDWDTYLNNYDKYQIERPVTPQEFNKALETVQSYQKKNVKTKKKKKKGELPQEAPQPPVKEVIIPSSSGILMGLPVAVCWNDRIISDGFYLAEKTVKDKNYFLKIVQSGKIFAEIETKISDAKYTGKTEILVQNTGNNVVKLIYIDREISLESELPVYVFNSAGQ